MCCGKHHKRHDTRLAATDHSIRPDEPCVLCAEKHLSTAYALSQECGYVPINRQRIIGELAAAQWHSWKTDGALAEMIRDIRHAVQARSSSIEWVNALQIMDRLASPPFGE